ncbi:hypothetical protein LEMLEM_LOCUS7096 [Lemmus lemmus]
MQSAVFRCFLRTLGAVICFYGPLLPWAMSEDQRVVTEVPAGNPLMDQACLGKAPGLQILDYL